MSRVLRTLLVGCVVGLTWLLVPQSAEAQRYYYRDGYWNDYWRWYDRDYSRYYRRRMYRRPYYYRHYYRPYYYRGYRNWGPGGGVQIGPLGIYWR